MDVHDLKKIVSKNDMDRQKKSSSFSQSDVSGKWASADESLSTRFNNKEAGFLAGIANSVGEQFNVSPSTILLPVWAFVFTSLFLATKYLFKNYQIHVMVPERTHTLSATKLVEAIAVSLFGINGCLQLSATMFQRLPKKRQLNSLVLFINFVPFVTYVCSLVDLFPSFRNAKGLPAEYLHIFQWMFTTPTMIIIISALGTSMRKSLVFNWRMTLQCILWDEFMLINGLFISFVPDPYHWVFFGLAVFGFCNTIYCIHKIVHYACKNAGTSFEVNSIKALETITWVLWSVFPLLECMELFGVISFHEHRVFRVLGDVFVKTVYSVSILSGNFCLLDTISELRLSQMRESNAESEENFDRTEKLNEALNMQCVEADTTARMAKRFVANLSHELRTPLNSVIAFNSLLLESGLEPIHQEYVRSSLTSAEALLGIIGQVLDYSKLEHSVNQDVVVEAAPFHISQVCDELLDVVVARAASRKVQFIFEDWEPIPFLVGDKFRLRQVLINLADNAVKFCPDENGIVVVSVTSEPIDNGTIMVQIDVTDNGIGIAEKKRDLIFQPFSQVYSDLSRKYGGTGLGLVISKKIVTAMHGQIDFISQEGKGTTFRILIPFLTVPASLPEYTIPKHVVMDAFKGASVVVCMPEKFITSNLATKLDKWGMSVKTAVFNEERKIGECLEFVKSMLRKDANCIAILDYSTVKTLFEDPTQRDLATSILCVGSFDEQVLAVHNAMVEVHRFVLSPMKFSALYNKIDALLSKPRERTSGTVSKPLESKPLPKSFDLPLAMSQQQQKADEASSARSMAGIAEVNEETPVKVPMLQPLDEAKTEPKVNVLIVEDHIVNQKVVCAMLNKVLSGNFAFKIANNGKEGFDAATEPGALYDLILMDIQMPVMDGLSATKMIRDWEQTHEGMRPSYYICAITAHASQADRNDCYDVGMNRYMTKPLNLSSMKEIIADWRKWDAESQDAMEQKAALGAS